MLRNCKHIFFYHFTTQFRYFIKNILEAFFAELIIFCMFFMLPKKLHRFIRLAI